jgi:hypothetical protein
MSPSTVLAKQKSSKKRGPGRPATGFDPMVGLRMPIVEREAIEAWGAKQDPPLKFSMAARRLLQLALAGQTTPPRRVKRKDRPS